MDGGDDEEGRHVARRMMGPLYGNTVCVLYFGCVMLCYFFDFLSNYCNYYDYIIICFLYLLLSALGLDTRALSGECCGWKILSFFFFFFF